MRLPALFRRHARRVRERREGPSRRGFTMVETLTVAVVMGTLARIATPDFHKVVLRARAADVAADFQTVQLAVLGYRADHAHWPDDSYAGVVPDGLASYLPAGFSFVRQGYRLDWEHWALPNGLPGHPEPGVLVGFSIVTNDRALGRAVVKLLGRSMPHYSLGSRYTFVLEGM